MTIGPSELIILLVIALMAVVPVAIVILVVRAAQSKGPSVIVPAAAPGWYPDPMGGAGRRYYDGQRWADHEAT